MVQTGHLTVQRENKAIMYRQLNSKRQLFINDDNIEIGRSEANYGCHNVQRVLHQPKKHGLVLMKDRPWESPVLDPVYSRTRCQCRLCFTVCLQWDGNVHQSGTWLPDMSSSKSIKTQDMDY